MLPAEPAEFLELETLRGLLLILIGDVIAVFTLSAGEYDVVAHSDYLSRFSDAGGTAIRLLPSAYCHLPTR